jgi:5,10-methylenetetrahydrofolate reductase
MNESSQISGQHRARFEVLPLGRGEEDAAKLPQPVRLTVTCSPRHGPDRSVTVARHLTALGHAVTVHLAARMVRDRGHLDKLLAEMVQAGVDDVLLIGGDATPPDGTGFHYYTFNQLIETWRWQLETHDSWPLAVES